MKKIFKSTALIEDSASEGIKLGFGFYRDFGVEVQFHGDVNGLITLIVRHEMYRSL